MKTRAECIAQMKADFLESFLSDLRSGFMDIKAINIWREIAFLENEEPKGRESRVMKYEEASVGVGIGWVENVCIDEDEPEKGPIVDVMPCAWCDGWIYDAENEPYMISDKDENGYWAYDIWPHGYRLWSDGEKPTEEARKKVPWITLPREGENGE